MIKLNCERQENISNFKNLALSGVDVFPNENTSLELIKMNFYAYLLIFFEKIFFPVSSLFFLGNFIFSI